MDRKFLITDLIVFAQLFLNFYVISNNPFADVLLTVIYYIQFLLFCSFFVVHFDFDRFFNSSFFKITTVSFLTLFLVSALLISSFYININENLNTDSIFKMISYFTTTYLFFYYLPKRFENNLEMLDSFLKAILIFALINSIYAIFGMATGFRQNEAFPGHCLGFFNHPNTHSFLYPVIFPIILFMFFTKKINLMLFLFLLFLFSFCLLFTFSRSGFISVGVTVLVYSFLKSKKLFFVVISLLFIISAFFLLDVAKSKTDSSVARLLLITAAVQMILNSPSSFLWGYGVFNSIEIFKVEKTFIGSLELVVDPHNWILLLGIQFGMIVPLLAGIIFLTIFGKGLWGMKKITEVRRKNYSILFVSICSGIFIQNFFEDVVVYPEYFVMPLFLICLGSIYVYYKSSVKKHVKISF